MGDHNYDEGEQEGGGRRRGEGILVGDDNYDEGISGKQKGGGEMERGWEGRVY